MRMRQMFNKKEGEIKDENVKSKEKNDEASVTMERTRLSACQREKIWRKEKSVCPG